MIKIPSREYKIVFLLLFLAWLMIPFAAIAKDTPPHGMFALYEQNRQQGIPNYITEDFMLLSHGMVINETVTMLEETLLLPEFKNLIDELTTKIIGNKEKISSVDKANLDYLAVLTCLITGAEQPDKKAVVNQKAVIAELKKVRAAKGIDTSTLMQQQIDYSQFIVRGKYTRNKKLGQYFQAMRYAGTVLFPILESKATGISTKQADTLSQQAMALAAHVHGSKKLADRYEYIQKLLASIFGPADDLILTDYVKILKKLPHAQISQLRQALFNLAEKNNRKPAIISGAVDIKKLEKGQTPSDVMTGFRFMPLRFTPDSAAMQQLVFNNVTRYQGKKTPFSRSLIDGNWVKGFPMGIELMAILGSKDAQTRLNKNDECNYMGYAAAKKKAGILLRTSSGLNSNHMQLMRYWLNTTDIPEEAINLSRRLNTCLGFWTYTRYISTLYAKQSYTTVAKSFSASPPRNQAWLSGAPELYAHLQLQAVMLNQMLPAEVNHPMKERLKDYIDVLETCRSIAFKELGKSELNADEIRFLNQLDTRLAYVVVNQDAPIVTDVHTEPNSGMVLQEGLGYPKIIMYPLEKVQARGALFNYYEFKHPINDRLTDDKWQKMLADPKAMEKLALSPGSS
ncbi:DUF3160 domain-containing protein [Desulfobacula toluolica]|uniref:DUF3160 domain-containing protein n=1 Tax=Desulfobacula toluolica (strain DSM 7467 / Tol2) TaxID=651182 RepID=K0NPD1_DESTT|nr:DUF3160 domain-containing protein [Desulfobacula toluolica]CCK80687.1 uncharacterized protein TOL2_C25280 [Desulfobacula toluolica Tol2]